MLTPEVEKFISQDTEALLKKLPGYISPVANFFTDLAGRANQVIYGQGLTIKKAPSLRKRSESLSFKITRSKNKNKKYTVIYNGKKIDFGDSRYSDYTQHKDPKRKALYIERHKKREDWKDPNTAGWWSRFYLWNKPTKQEAKLDIEYRLH